MIVGILLTVVIFLVLLLVLLVWRGGKLMFQHLEALRDAAYETAQAAKETAEAARVQAAAVAREAVAGRAAVSEQLSDAAEVAEGVADDLAAERENGGASPPSTP